MKTTLELPDELMRTVKIRAAMEGKKLKDVVAEALKAGLFLTGSAAHSSRGIQVETDPGTGLPVVIAVADAPGSALTPEELKRLEQDTLNREDLRRAGLSL
jgi:plasmid stability protein